MPLIGVASNPFRFDYTSMKREELSEERRGYLWLLLSLTDKIAQAVKDSGGAPVFLRPTAFADEISEIAARFDGFVFAGGSDIDPSFYNKENEGSHEPDIARDTFEFELMKRVLENEKPALGICRGCQLMNIVLGGTLHQHIPHVKEEWASHSRSDVTSGYVHNVKILKKSAFPLNKKETMEVNSMHHQAIDVLADSLSVTAITCDGLVEGVAHKHLPHFTGVQWHPECLAKSDIVQLDIFKALVEASRVF